MDAELPTIARRLKTARIRHQLSREALSEQVGVSAKSIQRYEEAKQMPRMKTLERLSEVLDIPLDSLFREQADARATLDDLAAGQQVLLERLDRLARSVERLTTVMESVLHRAD